MYQNTAKQAEKENILNPRDYSWETWVQGLISIKGDQRYNM